MFAITIVSVTTPTGNPQNFIIATNSGIKNSFLVFIKYLFLPTILNLIFTFFVLKLFLKKYFKNFNFVVDHSQEPIKNHNLAVLSKISIYTLLILIILKIIVSILKPNIDIKLVYITTISCLPIVVFSKERFKIIKNVDYYTFDKNLRRC